MSRHPIQPLETDAQGVVRFKSNKILRRLVDDGTISLNRTATFSDATPEDHAQLAMLIGYSLSGLGSLGYVSDEIYGAAGLMADGLGENEARIQHLETELAALRAALRLPFARLFGMHPDDIPSLPDSPET